MINDKTVVNVEAIQLHSHSHVMEVHAADVKVSGHSVQFKEPFKPTSLFLFEFNTRTRSQILSICVLFLPSLNSEILSILVKSVLV